MGGIKLRIGKDDGLRIKGFGGEKVLRLGGGVGLVDGDEVKIGDMINFVALAQEVFDLGNEEGFLRGRGGNDKGAIEDKPVDLVLIDEVFQLSEVLRVDSLRDLMIVVF